MPPFSYGSGYVNPYVQSISALLQQPGQIEAQRAMTVGNAQAQAAQASGQAYGNAIQSAGQAIGQIPQQMRAAQMQQLQMQDIKGQIAERNAAAAKAQRDMAAQTAGEQAIRGAVGPDGKIDYEKAASAWEQAGFPVQANAYRESVQKTRVTAQQLEEGQAKIEAGKRQVQQGYTDHLAELGAAGLEKLQTSSPVEARDYAMGLVANAASHGLVSPDDAKKTLMQTASASPEQLSAIYQKLVDASPTVKERLVTDALKRAETSKNLAEANKANAEAAAGPKPSAEQDTMRATNLRALVNLGKPISKEDAAWLKSHETEKTLGVDLTAGMASNRQATAIAAQTAQQARAQGFTELQTGKKELAEKVIAPYQTALASAQNLRDVVTGARAGNKIDASLQSLATTFAEVRSQNLNRVNAVELGLPANAGSAWDRLQGWFGKVEKGQAVPDNIQKDMLQFATLLERGAFKKYLSAHKSTVDLYPGLKDVKPLDGPTIYARDPQGVLHSAPYGQKLPKGWTEE